MAKDEPDGGREKERGGLRAEAGERAARLRAVNRQQMILRAVDVEQLIGPDHPARAIWALVGRLDLSRFSAAIGSVEGEAGRPAYDPHLLASLWIYAYRATIHLLPFLPRRRAPNAPRSPWPP